MYSVETLKKYRDAMEKKMNEYRKLFAGMSDAEIMLFVCFSKGNKKIGRVLNVSTAPVITCGNCSHCMGFCYDIKASVQYGNVLNARSRNTVIMLEYRDIYFEAIRNALRRRRTNKYFRFHVGGEIPDFDYFCEMVNIAKEFPDFRFWTYTKMHLIVNRYCDEYGRDAIPENLVVMFSEWDGMPLINPYGFPIFTCRLKDGNKNHSREWFDENCWKCPGNCDVCKAAGRGCLASENTFADEH